MAWAFAFGAAAVLFVRQERRAQDPMVSFPLWGARIIATLNGASVLVSMSLIGITTFLPMYVLVVLGRSSIVAGLALTMVMLGWPLGATLTSRAFHRVGLWRLVVIGSVLMPLGGLAFVLLRPDSSPVLTGIGSFVDWPGDGCAQLELPDSYPGGGRGAAAQGRDGVQHFSHNLGSALGGAIFNFGLSRANGGTMISEDQLHRLLQGVHKGEVATVAEISLRNTLADSLQLTFW